MRSLRRWIPVLLSLAFLAATSPDTRPITDPKSIASDANPGAGAVPIDDLYFTRAVGFGPSWSPDGKEVVFSTNLTGAPTCGR